jgi:transcriptional regulator with XRE-family HTH domain
MSNRGGGIVARKDTMGAAARALVEELVHRRKEKGLSQEAVARAMRTDQSQISKLERGERRFDVIDYVRYCRAIDLDPGEPLRGLKIR